MTPGAEERESHLLPVRLFFYFLRSSREGDSRELKEPRFLLTNTNTAAWPSDDTAMVSSLAERFRRAVLSDDLPSAKTIAQRALAETCNDAHPFDIRNQTILRTSSQSHHISPSSGTTGSSSSSSSSSSTTTNHESSILATSQSSMAPALSESQHHFAKQSRVRERNRQAGRCKSSLALAIESEASIEMIQWLLDMGHERGQCSRDYRNCTMLSLAAQYNRTDVIEALCVDAVANAASIHHQESNAFDGGFQRHQQQPTEDDDEEGLGDRDGDEEVGEGHLAKLALQEDNLHKNQAYQSGQSYQAKGKGADSTPRTSMEKGLPKIPSPSSQRATNEGSSEVDKIRSSSDESNDDSVAREVKQLLDSPDELGRTALALTSMKGYQEAATHLLDLGANINLADYEGNTPLHYASSYNHLLIVQLLIERGCAFATKNSFGFTAADYAYTSSLKGALEAFARAKFERDRKGVHEADDARAVQTNQKIKQTLLASAKSMQASLQYRLGH
jgi:hypothetical protein